MPPHPWRGTVVMECPARSRAVVRFATSSYFLLRTSCFLLFQFRFVFAGHQGPGGPAQEEHGEAGVPGGVEPVRVLAPGAVVLLGGDEGGGALGVPEMVADLLGPAISNCQLFGRLRSAYEDLSHAQNQLVQAEKMRALGELAGGMAHDLGLGCGDPREIEIVGDETAAHENWRFVGPFKKMTFASRMQHKIYWGAMKKPIEWSLKTVLAPWAYIASVIYHDSFWYPLNARKTMQQVLASPWGRLFRNWEQLTPDANGFPQVGEGAPEITLTGGKALIRSLGILGTCIAQAWCTTVSSA